VKPTRSAKTMLTTLRSRRLGKLTAPESTSRKAGRRRRTPPPASRFLQDGWRGVVLPISAARPCSPSCASRRAARRNAPDHA
jgi:hypothetical protein